MHFHWSKHLKLFFIVAIGGILSTLNINASASSEASDITNYIQRTSCISITKNLPEDPALRQTIIKNIFKDPDASVFNLSLSDIGDEDLPSVFKGLASRKITSDARGDSILLQLLDLNNSHISRDGIENLLRLLQKGARLPTGDRVYPDVRETIIKVSPSVDVTEELLASWHSIAPSVFAGGLTIIE